MNLSFKLYFDKDNSTVIKGKFSDYKSFEQIRKKIIKTSQSSTLKAQKKTFRERDILLLSFFEDSPFIPPGLEQGIWDKKTYEYFIEKVQSINLSKGSYKFYIEKRAKKPIFNEIKLPEILKNTLQVTWKSVEHKLTTDLSLPVLEEGKKKYEEKKEIYNDGLKKLMEEKHEGFICSNCYEKDFLGPRFVCSECKNYNLCSNCENLLKIQEIHDREHVLIKINKPKGQNEIFQFNNFLGPREQINHTSENCFDIKLAVINTGDNDLEKCFIMPIRYGENYLECKPYVIDEKLGRNERKDIELRIRRNAKLSRGIFHGYFRMFTPNGIPFGKVLHLQNIIGE